MSDTVNDSAGADFDAFWAEYPRKVAKGAARKAWPKALKKTDAGTVMAALAAQKAAGLGRDPLYTKHPATWLNGECWLDEIPAAGGGVPVAAPKGEDYGF